MPSAECGVSCHRTREHANRTDAASVVCRDYVRTAREKERAALDAARKEYLRDYPTRRLLACYALDDLVGIAIVRKEGYVVWRAYSPITGEFGNAKVVPQRSHGLCDNDVRHLSGYSLSDPVRVQSLH